MSSAHVIGRRAAPLEDLMANDFAIGPVAAFLGTDAGKLPQLSRAVKDTTRTGDSGLEYTQTLHKTMFESPPQEVHRNNIDEAQKSWNTRTDALKAARLAQPELLLQNDIRDIPRNRSFYIQRFSRTFRGYGWGLCGKMMRAISWFLGEPDLRMARQIRRVTRMAAYGHTRTINLLLPFRCYRHWNTFHVIPERLGFLYKAIAFPIKIVFCVILSLTFCVDLRFYGLNGALANLSITLEVTSRVVLWPVKLAFNAFWLLTHLPMVWMAHRSSKHLLSNTDTKWRAFPW